MDTVLAFLKNLGNQNSAVRVFDWIKAAKLIVENKPDWVGAGLGTDWEWTGGTIYSFGEPIFDSYTYLASTWAVPEIDIDGNIQPCWIYLDDAPEGYDQHTKWPQEALDILNEHNC